LFCHGTKPVFAKEAVPFPINTLANRNHILSNINCLFAFVHCSGISSAVTTWNRCHSSIPSLLSFIETLCAMSLVVVKDDCGKHFVNFELLPDEDDIPELVKKYKNLLSFPDKVNLQVMKVGTQELRTPHRLIILCDIERYARSSCY
jgi:hypothetical protein